MNQVEKRVLSIFQRCVEEPRIINFTERDMPDAILEFELL